MWGKKNIFKGKVKTKQWAAISQTPKNKIIKTSQQSQRFVDENVNQLLRFIWNHNWHCTHRWQSACSWCWRCQSRWWPCRRRCRRPPSPLPWCAGRAAAHGTVSSRCGCVGHLWSTSWAAAGRPPRGTPVWPCDPDGRFDDGPPSPPPWEDLQQKKNKKTLAAEGNSRWTLI